MSDSKLFYIDGFEDYDLEGQGYNYYLSSGLKPYPGRASQGAQGGATYKLPGDQPLVTIGFAYRLNDYIPAASMPSLITMQNLVQGGFTFELNHYDDNATAVAAVHSGGTVVDVSVTHGGCYYDTVPDVKLINTVSGGTYSSIDVSISGGQVISIIVNGASGYDDAHPPAVSIPPGGRGFSTASGMLGSATFGSATAKYIKPGQWNYFEFQAQAFPVLNVFTGEYHAEIDYTLKVNGVTWLSTTLDSPEKPVGPNFNWSTIGFNTNIVGVFDDLYITDGEFLADGLFENGQQGLAIKTLRPVGPGAYTGFTPSDPDEPNWKMVDDLTPDGDATTVSSGQAEDLFGPVVDTYKLSQLPSIYTDIRGAQADYYVTKTNAGPCRFNALRGDSGGGLFTLETFYPSLGNYTAFCHAMRYRISDSPWTLSDINSVQIGLEKAP
ncbi:MAG TPA: hypothetical protein VGN17_28575 [Bryobacteraceae bacterium]|jgi:hypothetical protein